MFKIIIKGNIEETFKKVQNEVEKNGGTMYKNGLEVKGVKIKFEVDGNNISIKILDMPWLVSESYIEEKIREYFKT